MNDTSEDTQKALQLLDTFDAVNLGEGDIASGANVLVAMSVALAAIHKPVTGLVVTTTGERIGVGTSIVVSGGHSQTLVAEKVAAPVAECQNNLVANLREWAHIAAAETAKPKQMREFDPALLLEIGTGSALYDLHTEPLFPGQQSELVSGLIKPPILQGKRELHNRPAFFICANDANSLSHQLQ
jgi:hypothetical protein